VANSLAAIAAGADCIHTTIFGIGERCGNTALEPLIANLHYLYGTCYRFDLLPQLSEYSSLIFGETVHPRHPVIGKNAYSTAAGIHGAAILKALELKQPELIANIYAGVDPRLSNRKVDVQVGPLSGIANIKWKASQLKFQFSKSLSMEILDSARRKDRILTDEEILKIVETHRKGSECNEI
jgi:2-isopropylmalate synthase